MSQEKSRIEVLKEKMDQNKIALELFGTKEGHFSFCDSISSKNKLKIVYEIAYNNIIHQAKSDIDENYTNALSTLELTLKSLEIYIKNNEYLSFFAFENMAYEITLPAILLIKHREKIVYNLGNQDILIYSPSLNFGACILVDENCISFSNWNL